MREQSGGCIDTPGSVRRESVCQGFRPRGQDLRRQPVHPPELLDRRLRRPAGSRTLLGVENPSTATIVCQGDTFTFKLDQALADNGGIFLVNEDTEGQPTVSPAPTARPPASSSLRNPPIPPSTSTPTTWPKTAPPTPPPRKSSSATTTSTAPPAKSPAPCWPNASGPPLTPAASPSPALPGPSGLT